MDRPTDIALDDRTLNELENGAYFVTAERKIVSWNTAAETITGYAGDEVTGSHCFNDILMHQDESGECICKTGCPLEAAIRDGATHEADLFLHHKKGQLVKVSVLTAPVYDIGNRIVGAVEIFQTFPSKRVLRRSLKDLTAKTRVKAQQVSS